MTSQKNVCVRGYRKYGDDGTILAVSVMFNAALRKKGKEEGKEEEVKHISSVVYRDISSSLLHDEIPAIKIIGVNFAYSCCDPFDRTGPS